jgi:hypothetical protein
VFKQKNFKYELIQSAARVFCLSQAEKETLANKGGLSFRIREHFSIYLQQLIAKSGKSCRALYEEAQISERMFYLIKAGRTPSKTTLLALAITLGMNIDEIDILLPMTGYVLSRSIAFDVVVRYLLGQKYIGNHVMSINDVLSELELPLLMTREKRSPN